MYNKLLGSRDTDSEFVRWSSYSIMCLCLQSEKLCPVHFITKYAFHMEPFCAKACFLTCEKLLGIANLNRNFPVGLCTYM